MNDLFLRHVLAEVLGEQVSADERIVFPNARALSHFKALFADEKKNSLLPEMMTVSDFIDQKSNLRLATNFEQRRLLDDLLSKENLALSERQRDFLLADWNAIHVNQADESVVWRSSLEIYRMAQLDSGDSTIADRIRVLESVGSLRESFDASLRKSHLGTQGMRLDAAREKILKDSNPSVLRLVGFSKFSPLEWLFFTDLNRFGKVIFHSDLHEEYMSVKGHEASRVFKDIPASAFRQDSTMVSSLRTLACPGQHHQAKLVETLVVESLNRNQTVGVVLMNEDSVWTLLPMLRKHHAQINCSIKLDLSKSRAFARLVELLSDSRKIISDEELAHSLNELAGSSKTNQLEQLSTELILREWQVFNRLNQGKASTSISSDLFLNDLRTKGLVVKGDQNAPIQIMGLLETRALNFDELLLCNMNEGEIQGKSVFNSLIPHEVKSGFSLPSQADHDSLMAYHLYRLFMGTRNLTFLYIESGLDIKTGEQSRVMKQLEYQHNIESSELNSEAQTSDATDDFTWDARIWNERVWKFLEKGLSASALNSFMRIRNEFARSYLMGIRRPSSIDDMEMYAQLGIYAHDVLEQLYKPFVGVDLRLKSFDQMDVEGQLKSSLSSTIEEVLSKRPFLLGLVKDSILQLIRQDRAEVAAGNQIRILALEKLLTCELELMGRKIKLKGYIDRLEERNGRLTVVDYKTGTLVPADLKYKEIDGLFDLSKPKDKVHQLFLYALLVSNSKNWKGQLPDLSIQSLLVRAPKRFSLSFKSSEAYLVDLQKYERELMGYLESEMIPCPSDSNGHIFSFLES